MQTIKSVVVGDGTVGKTCMLITYSTNKFPTEYVPTVFDNYAVDLVINDKNYTLALFDTAGQEGFEQLRPIAYPQTDVFLVCFSTVFPSSLVNIQKQWIAEIRKYCPVTPFLLIGTKIDIRDDREEIERLLKKKERPITYDEGVRVARQLKAVKYIECSALTGEGIRDVFDEAILTVLNKPKHTNSKCILL